MTPGSCEQAVGGWSARERADRRFVAGYDVGFLAPPTAATTELHLSFQLLTGHPPPVDRLRATVIADAALNSLRQPHPGIAFHSDPAADR